MLYKFGNSIVSGLVPRIYVSSVASLKQQVDTTFKNQISCRSHELQLATSATATAHACTQLSAHPSSLRPKYTRTRFRQSQPYLFAGLLLFYSTLPALPRAVLDP
jgi:hypothetical protein